MDGIQKRTAHVQPVAGVLMLIFGIALLWLVPHVPDLVGISALVGGALVLVNEFA